MNCRNKTETAYGINSKGMQMIDDDKLLPWFVGRCPTGHWGDSVLRHVGIFLNDTLYWTWDFDIPVLVEVSCIILSQDLCVCDRIK